MGTEKTTPVDVTEQPAADPATRRITNPADYIEKPEAAYPKAVGGTSVRSGSAVRPSQAVLDAVKALGDTTSEALDATLRKL